MGWSDGRGSSVYNCAMSPLKKNLDIKKLFFLNFWRVTHVRAHHRLHGDRGKSAYECFMSPSKQAGSLKTFPFLKVLSEESLSYWQKGPLGPTFIKQHMQSWARGSRVGHFPLVPWPVDPSSHWPPHNKQNPLQPEFCKSLRSGKKHPLTTNAWK